MKKILAIILSLTLVVPTMIACGNGGSGDKEKKEINVYNWGEYIANGTEGSMDVIKEFEKRTGIKVNYTTFDSNESMYNKLKSSNDSYDVIIPSDYMISKLIKEDMVQKINFENVPNYSNIKEEFKNMPFDPKNEYSVPYTWGIVGLVYNKTMINEPVDSWDMLWNENYSGQILMIDNSKDAFAIASKRLGFDDPNVLTKEELEKATAELRAQKPVVKAYVMDQVFNLMESDQAAIAPYYVGDAMVMMENNENLDFAIPKEGTNLFVDSMCIPKNAKNVEGAEEFINFILEGEIGKEIVEFTGYSTPNSAVFDLLDEETRNNPNTYPPAEVLANTFTFSDVDKETYDFMQLEWIDIKK